MIHFHNEWKHFINRVLISFCSLWILMKKSTAALAIKQTPFMYLFIYFQNPSLFTTSKNRCSLRPLIEKTY